MTDVEAYRKGYKLGWEAGYANAISHKDWYAWGKLFWVVFAASFTAFGVLYLLTFV